VVNIKNIFDEHCAVINSLEKMIPDLELVAHKILASYQNKGTVFWMGNGGSAADAQHMAAELIGRYKKERRALASIALNTDTSILTSLSNDYDFSIIFARQLEALCRPQDIVIGLSTSGNSENVLKGLEVAKKIGAYTIGFTGFEGGKLKNLVDSCFIIPSQNTPRIQEAHQLLCHTLCECVENFFKT
jgi:D-sedoheptulose 7-phosphate isomerase